MVTYTVQAGDLPGTPGQHGDGDRALGGRQRHPGAGNGGGEPGRRGVAFTKTVGILGIAPECTAATDILVPVNTTMVYCFSVENTGAVALLLQSLTDSHLGELSLPPNAVLAPGQTSS